MALVMKTLDEVARAVEWRLRDRDPQVFMLEFANHSVNFEVAVWMSDPWQARPTLSKLNQAIWQAFKEKEIVIAFPQVDVHLDPPVVEGLKALGRSRSPGS